MTQFRPFEWNTFDDSRGDREKQATKKNWWASHLSRHTPRLFPTRLTFEALEKDSFKRVVHYSKGFNLRNWCFFNESSNASSRGAELAVDWISGLSSLFADYFYSICQLFCEFRSVCLPGTLHRKICFKFAVARSLLLGKLSNEKF